MPKKRLPVPSHVVRSIRFTDAEFAQLKSHVIARNTTLSDLIREGLEATGVLGSSEQEAITAR